MFSKVTLITMIYSIIICLLLVSSTFASAHLHDSDFITNFLHSQGIEHEITTPIDVDEANLALINRDTYKPKNNRYKLLYSQSNLTSVVDGYSSEIFVNEDVDGFIVADDFNIPSSKIWKIDSISIPFIAVPFTFTGPYTLQSTGADKFVITIYKDNHATYPDGPGDIINTQSRSVSNNQVFDGGNFVAPNIIPGFIFYGIIVNIDIEPILLKSGHYWISAQRSGSSQCCFWFIVVSNIVENEELYRQTFACTELTPGSICTEAPPRDVLFSLYGKQKCCSTQYKQCYHSSECCDDLVCEHWKCVKQNEQGWYNGYDYHHHSKRSGVWSGGSSKRTRGSTRSGIWYNAKKEESVTDDMNNLNVISDDVENKNKWKWGKHTYLYIIIGGILFACITSGINNIWCYYRSNKKQKALYDIDAIHQYTETDADDSEIQDGDE